MTRAMVRGMGAVRSYYRLAGLGGLLLLGCCVVWPWPAGPSAVLAWPRAPGWVLGTLVVLVSLLAGWVVFLTVQLVSTGVTPCAWRRSSPQPTADERMDNGENFRERLEARDLFITGANLHILHGGNATHLEPRTEHLMHHTRTIERRLRWWRGMAGGVLMLGLLSWALPSSKAQDASSAKGHGDLAQRVAALEDKLVHVTRVDTDLFITGANLHIVNGGNATHTVNGLGNLIVGYNEPRSRGTNTRTGSHNVVVGMRHNFSAYGGLVVGLANEITGPWASVSGGTANTAYGASASVSGGAGNIASAGASVSGGTANTANGRSASVSGGIDNAAIGDFASVCGGRANLAVGDESAVSGGTTNTADGRSASVSGGVYNTARGISASVSGGAQNRATGANASVSGGTENRAEGSSASVSGGVYNTARGQNSAVGAGRQRVSAQGVRSRRHLGVRGRTVR